MLNRYKFLKSAAKTSASLALQISFLRKQIIWLITLYQTYALLKTFIDEYKEYAYSDPSKQSTIDKIKKMALELIKIISIFESKEGFTFRKAMGPIT
jgi:hypothetical protein